MEAVGSATLAESYSTQAPRPRPPRPSCLRLPSIATPDPMDENGTVWIGAYHDLAHPLTVQRYLITDESLGKTPQASRALQSYKDSFKVTLEKNKAQWVRERIAMANAGSGTPHTETEGRFMLSLQLGTQVALISQTANELTEKHRLAWLASTRRLDDQISAAWLSATSHPQYTPLELKSHVSDLKPDYAGHKGIKASRHKPDIASLHASTLLLASSLALPFQVDPQGWYRFTKGESTLPSASPPASRDSFPDEGASSNTLTSRIVSPSDTVTSAMTGSEADISSASAKRGRTDTVKTEEPPLMITLFDD